VGGARPDKIQLLLDAAPTERAIDDRRTALVVASGIVGAAPALRLLLDTARTRRSGSRQTRRRCAEAVRVDEARCFGCCGVRRQPERRGGMSATFLERTVSSVLNWPAPVDLAPTSS